MTAAYAQAGIKPITADPRLDAPRPRIITTLPDGTPVYSPEWSPFPVDKPGDKPAERARFPEGQPGRDRLEPSRPPVPSPDQGRDAGAPRSGAEGILERGGTVAGGFRPPPVARGSGSAPQPLFVPPDVTANEPASRNVGQYLSTPPKVYGTLETDDETGQRSKRFERLRIARSILRGTPLGVCMRYARAGAVQVVLFGETAGYRGWQHCGSRLCPWCSAMLAQADTSKAERFIRGWVKRKNAIALCHYTLRHTADETPADVWEAQTKVLQSLHSGRPWRELVAEFGLLEHIYGNEVMDGGNGCHKHQHRAWEIQMCDALKGRTERRRFGKRLQAAYEKLYLAALLKHGRSALPGIALQVSIAAPTMANAAKAAEYVSKFSKETQQGGLKSGSRGNHTVFELLDIAGDKGQPKEARAAARARYADLYFGLKGKHWSYFSEATAANNELAGGEEEVPEVALDDEGEVVMELTAPQAAMLADQDMQCRLLEMIEQHGVEYAVAWLRDFTNPDHWSQDFKARFRGG